MRAGLYTIRAISIFANVHVRKSFLTMAVVASTILLQAETIDETNSFYIGVGVSAESPIIYNDGWAGVLTVGKPFMRLGSGELGAEVEVSNSLQDSSKNSIDFSAKTVAGYATYIWDVDPKLYIKPRLGVVYKKYSIESDVWGDDSSNEVDIAGGLGVGIRILDNINIYTDYTLLEKSDFTHLTMGVEYLF